MMPTNPPLRHFSTAPRVTCLGMLNLPGLDISLCQLLRSVTIHQGSKSVLNNLIYYRLPKFAHESRDKDCHVNILSHTVLGKLHELIIILSHHYIPLVKSLKLIHLQYLVDGGG